MHATRHEPCTLQLATVPGCQHSEPSAARSCAADAPVLVLTANGPDNGAGVLVLVLVRVLEFAGSSTAGQGRPFATM
jgi:hypothetical protein